MNWRDTVIREFILVWGIGMRWLGEDLQALRVRVPLCSICLKELLHDADAAVCSVLQTRESGATTYAEELRSQLAMRSQFIYAWTTSGDVISADAASQALVKIARKYALPRPWKVSEPSVVEYDRVAPATWAREAPAAHAHALSATQYASVPRR